MARRIRPCHSGRQPSIAADPALATVVKRSNRAHLIHFAAANLRNPGAPVPANLGPEPLRMARDLVRVGLDALALDIYRIRTKRGLAALDQTSRSD